MCNSTNHEAHNLSGLAYISNTQPQRIFYQNNQMVPIFCGSESTSTFSLSQEGRCCVSYR